jgi:hypothetical protein
MTGTMRDSGYELRGIPLPRTPVNKGEKRKGRDYADFRELRIAEAQLPRTPLPGNSVNRIRRRAPGRARKVSHHTSVSGRALLTVPAYGTLDGLPEWRRLLAELPFEPGVIYDERFLELVEHLDRLADARVEKT